MKRKDFFFIFHFFNEKTVILLVYFHLFVFDGRNPVEMSFCVESMLPYHTATASALMTSMLSISGHTYGWLSDGTSSSPSSPSSYAA